MYRIGVRFRSNVYDTHRALTRQIIWCSINGRYCFCINFAVFIPGNIASVGFLKALHSKLYTHTNTHAYSITARLKYAQEKSKKKIKMLVVTIWG